MNSFCYQINILDYLTIFFSTFLSKIIEKNKYFNIKSD
ncbi:hypothetical protein c7_L1264 [Megavirus courdo7]|uniref:Uncharacterized protein n=1 Tax=Megavirus courdo7 TaxID=1128135 RepID=H2ECK3_9VIRU|nr:hypothetical protein c7_L1264 [Megavirus courdo7]